MPKKFISIFTPVWNESGNVLGLIARVRETMQSLDDRYDYEYVFSDNASADNTLMLLKQSRNLDRRIKVIKLSKNFGVIRSTLNGLFRCSGDAVIQIEGDLQDPPEMIPEFLRAWESGYKVVYGIRKDRDEFVLMKWTRKLFYRIAAKLATDTLIPDVGEFRLMDRRIIEELKKINDCNPYLRGIIANLGFEQLGIEYKRDRRRQGKSSMNVFSLFDYGLNGIISHSKVMLRLSTITGMVLAVLTFFFAILFAILKFTLPDVPRGFTLVLMSIFFFAGIQMIFLGVIGEYIAKIFDQSIRRPIVVEEELLGFEVDSKNSLGVHAHDHVLGTKEYPA